MNWAFPGCPHTPVKREVEMPTAAVGLTHWQPCPSGACFVHTSPALSCKSNSRGHFPQTQTAQLSTVANKAPSHQLSLDRQQLALLLCFVLISTSQVGRGCREGSTFCSAGRSQCQDLNPVPQLCSFPVWLSRGSLEPHAQLLRAPIQG